VFAEAAIDDTSKRVDLSASAGGEGLA